MKMNECRVVGSAHGSSIEAMTQLGHYPDGQAPPTCRLQRPWAGGWAAKTCLETSPQMHQKPHEITNEPKTTNLNTQQTMKH